MEKPKAALSFVVEMSKRQCNIPGYCKRNKVSGWLRLSSNQPAKHSSHVVMLTASSRLAN